MGLCCSKGRTYAKCDMSTSILKLSGKIAPIISKFSKEEISLLRELYIDLSRRTDSHQNIDKETFIQFFPLPGMLSERLFKLFDTTGSGVISFEDFMIGIARFSKGTDEEKLQMIFDLYDLCGDGYIDRAELLALIHNSLKETLIEKTIVPEGEKDANAEGSFSDLVISMRTPKYRIHKSRSGSSYSLRTQSTMSHHNSKAQLLASQVLEQYGERGVLTFKEFVNFIDQHPNILQLFSAVFKEDIWSSTAKVLDSPKKICKTPKTKSDQSNSEPISPSKIPSLNCIDMSGTVYKKNKEKDELEKKYAILKKNLLVFFDNEEDVMPSGVVFMEGCYVDVIGDYLVSNKFGISLSHQNAAYQEVLIYCDLRTDRDEWVKMLENAAKTRKFKEFYELKERLGHGKFSDVYEAVEHSTNMRWAVKVINKIRLNKQEKEFLRTEIAIMRLIDHPNVIQLKEVFDTKKHLLIVMEIVEGGELFERIVKKKVFSEYAASQIIKQLLEVVCYLHEVGIIHRDIKPENILLGDTSDIPQIKLADFGLSKLTGPNDIQTLACGTLGYAAPEVLSQEGYTFKADIWSIGIVAYLLLAGRLPFDHKEKQVLIDLTLNGAIPFEGLWDRYTPLATDFIKKLMNRNVDERPTAREALQHPWIKTSDVMIPRAINKQKMAESHLKRGLTSSNLASVEYTEMNKSESTKSLDSIYNSTVIQSLPDLLLDIEPLRRHHEERNIIEL
ncbi:unnamed protein product [Blepharisma stoltei]|uniref:non-specific serine/threonine protein kinase n=1 Tax=Blepharisma stoltei TaxID=1481888 RepID=A0AAU9JIH5_9CILI|nr:unnamed protein product [Blepharisma stoltei]